MHHAGAPDDSRSAWHHAAAARAHLGQKSDTGCDAVEKICQVKLFIWRMHSVVRQGKAHQYRWYSERRLKGIDDRDGAAGSKEDGRRAEPFAVSDSRRAHGRMLAIDYGGRSHHQRANR